MTDIPDLISRMSSISFFAELSYSEQKRLIGTGSTKQYTQGKTIIEEGLPCSGLFVLISGEVYLKKIGPEGQYHTLHVLNPVSMFNEVAVLDQGNNPASAFSGKDSVIWRIDQKEFLNTIRMNSSLAVGFLSMMAKRNRLLLTQYEDISFLTVHSRLAKLLLELSNEGNTIINREKHTTSELSERLGTVPEVFCRALKSLREKGLIEASRSEIKVNNTNTLSKIGSYN
ncbi:MAG: Crp/Fnr family transcriptional regulator [Spirochaetales bacterium]|nr:Crp/Fnr family transcriptional regulator [Spirochaetales bacterium]